MKRLLILAAIFVSTTLLLSGCTNNVEVKKSDRITVSYDSFSEDGKIIEEGIKETFVVGMGQTFPAFDKELIGMKNGEKKQFTTTSENGYFIKYQNNKIQEINPAVFANIGTKPTMGEIISLGNIKGLVLDISPTAVKIDFNEPYTREPATFIVRILEIEKN